MQPGSGSQGPGRRSRVPQIPSSDYETAGDLMGHCLPNLVNQPVEWLIRHWFTTGVDHEPDRIRPLLDSRAGGVSIEVQRSAVERVAESNGWDLTWLADEGVSGAVPPKSRKAVQGSACAAGG